MKSTVSPVRDFPPESVSWAKRNSFSSVSKQNRRIPLSSMKTTTDDRMSFELFPTENFSRNNTSTNDQQPQSRSANHLHAFKPNPQSIDLITDIENKDLNNIITIMFRHRDVRRSSVFLEMKNKSKHLEEK